MTCLAAQREQSRRQGKGTGCSEAAASKGKGLGCSKGAVKEAMKDV